MRKQRLEITHTDFLKNVKGEVFRIDDRGVMHVIGTLLTGFKGNARMRKKKCKRFLIQRLTEYMDGRENNKDIQSS